MLWVEFGQGQSNGWFSIHNLAKWHALLSCLPSLAVTWSQPLEVEGRQLHGKHEVGPVFSKLRQYKPSIEYPDSLCCHYVWQTQQHYQGWWGETALVAQKQRPYDSIHPTSTLDDLHSKLLAYGANQQIVQCNLKVLATAWGWQKGEVWEVLWSTLPPIAQSCQQLTKCRWTCEYRGPCKCYRYTLKCTQLCTCKHI